MINKKNIRKWYKMLLHKSNLYVNQPMGSFFEIDRINGYYNDLREKVKKERKVVVKIEHKKSRIRKGRCRAGRETDQV